MAVQLTVKLENPARGEKKMARSRRECQHELGLNMLQRRTCQGVREVMSGRVTPHKQSPV